jgi:thioredoxin reductase
MAAATIYDLAVVGAGITTLSGLSAGGMRGAIVVLEYDDEPGGLLRAALPARGFEEIWTLVRDFRAGANAESAKVRYGATVVGLLPALSYDEPHTLLVRTRQGTEDLRAWTVLLACGGLETPREHAQIPGSRPAGVYTPVLAHAVLRKGYLPGRRVLVYGAGRYVVATAERLATAGAEVLLVPSSTAWSGMDAGEVIGSLGGAQAVRREPPAELAAVHGFPRVERIVLRRAGELVRYEADTLIYGAGLLPNTHWLAGSGITLGEEGTILVDARYQTNIAGIYAAGTVVVPDLDHTRSMAMGREVAAILSGGKG